MAETLTIQKFPSMATTLRKGPMFAEAQMVDLSMYEQNANLYSMGIDELDKMFKAKVYFPYNNYEYVIERCNRFKISCVAQKLSTNYALSLIVKKKILRV
jgi:hypothetical protein